MMPLSSNSSAMLWAACSHALLVIGMEFEGEEGKEKLLKLFCYSNTHPYWYITDEDSCKVNIKEIITFEY